MWIFLIFSWNFTDFQMEFSLDLTFPETFIFSQKFEIKKNFNLFFELSEISEQIYLKFHQSPSLKFFLIKKNS